MRVALRRAESRERRAFIFRAHHRDCKQKSGHPRGLTLLEVLVSTAIFLGALTAILQVLRVGHNSRVEAVLDADAVLRCETVMGELISGIRPLASTGEQSFEDNSDWVWTATVSDQGGEALLTVDVTVEHRANGVRTNSMYSLTRYVRDPELFIEAAGAGE